MPDLRQGNRADIRFARAFRFGCAALLTAAALVPGTAARAKVGANSFCNSYVIPPAGTVGAISAPPALSAVPPGGTTTCVASTTASSTQSTSLTNVGGSLEVGEQLVPVAASTGALATNQAQTVWFQWTPVQNTTATITVTSNNTNAYQFQPILRIYGISPTSTGLAINTITQAANYAVSPNSATGLIAPVIGQATPTNLASDGIFQSVALLTATANTTYLIQVDGVASPNFPYVGQGNFTFSLTPSTTTASPPVFQPQSGWWWSPNYPGLGFGIETRFSNAFLNPGAFFMGAFLYDDLNQPQWLIGQGQLIYVPGAGPTPGPAKAPSYYSVSSVNLAPLWQLYSGGTPLGTPFGGTTTQRIATLLPTPNSFILRFFSNTRGQIEFTGYPTPLPIQRYPVPGAQPATALPSTSATTSSSGTVLQTGWYWNNTDQGRGYFIEQQAGALQVAAYLYRPSSQNSTAIWYVSTNTLGTTQNYSGRLYEYTGGTGFTALQGSLTPIPVLNSIDRGPITITPSSPTTASIVVGGVTIPLTKFTF